ncbi:MAG: SEC-C domain-containing protein [Actinomycetota bacterium]|nr:SEC-C domain-containing protein [Actinomycetota bacterium]
MRIRVLVHDGPNSVSLLTHLGVRDQLPYLDTASAEMAPPLIGFHGGLTMISAMLGPEGHSKFAPPLANLAPDRHHPPATFVDWWNETIVADSRGNRFSRRAFVMPVANQDGGAHVDATIDAAYAALSRDHSHTTFMPEGGEDPHYKNMVLPSIRQIAYELEQTLSEQLVADPEGDLGLRIREPICSLSIHEQITTGLNDACPCGSGLKTKNCFGQRQPRRAWTMQDLAAEMQGAAPEAG